MLPKKRDRNSFFLCETKFTLSLHCSDIGEKNISSFLVFYFPNCEVLYLYLWVFCTFAKYELQQSVVCFTILFGKAVRLELYVFCCRWGIHLCFLFLFFSHILDFVSLHFVILKEATVPFWFILMEHVRDDINFDCNK